MTYGKSTQATQNQGEGFDPKLGIQQFGIPVDQRRQGWSQTSIQRDPANPGNNRQIKPLPGETPGETGGVPPIQPPVENQFPPGTQPTQTFMEDVLRRNLGNFISVSVSFGNIIQEFRGNVIEVGTSFVVIEDKRLESRVILPTLFINFVQVPTKQIKSTKH